MTVPEFGGITTKSPILHPANAESRKSGIATFQYKERLANEIREGIMEQEFPGWWPGISISPIAAPFDDAASQQVSQVLNGLKALGQMEILLRTSMGTTPPYQSLVRRAVLGVNAAESMIQFVSHIRRKHAALLNKRRDLFGDLRHRELELKKYLAT